MDWTLHGLITHEWTKHGLIKHESIKYGLIKHNIMLQSRKEERYIKWRKKKLNGREYSQLSLRQTPLGPVLCVRLIESEIRRVKKSRDQR